MEDKGKMDELIEQMKLMNERLGKMDERMEKMTKLLGQSMYHQQRTDFTSEYVARQQGYTGFINEDIAVAPKPPSRLFGNHFINIYLPNCLKVVFNLSVPYYILTLKN